MSEVDVKVDAVVTELRLLVKNLQDENDQLRQKLNKFTASNTLLLVGGHGQVSTYLLANGVDRALEYATNVLKYFTQTDTISAAVVIERYKRDVAWKKT